MKTSYRLLECEVCKKYTNHEVIAVKTEGDMLIISKKCLKHEDAERIYAELDINDLQILP